MLRDACCGMPCAAGLPPAPRPAPTFVTIFAGGQASVGTALAAPEPRTIPVLISVRPEGPQATGVGVHGVRRTVHKASVKPQDGLGRGPKRTKGECEGRSRRWARGACLRCLTQSRQRELDARQRELDAISLAQSTDSPRCAGLRRGEHTRRQSPTSPPTGCLAGGLRVPAAATRWASIRMLICLSLRAPGAVRAPPAAAVPCCSRQRRARPALSAAGGGSRHLGASSQLRGGAGGGYSHSAP